MLIDKMQYPSELGQLIIEVLVVVAEEAHPQTIEVLEEVVDQNIDLGEILKDWIDLAVVDKISQWEVADEVQDLAELNIEFTSKCWVIDYSHFEITLIQRLIRNINQKVVKLIKKEYRNLRNFKHKIFWDNLYTYSEGNIANTLVTIFPDNQLITLHSI